MAVNEEKLAGIFQATPQQPDATKGLFMVNDAIYQATICNAIRAAPMPVTIRPDLLNDVIAYARTSQRLPHDAHYVRNGVVTPPPAIMKAINEFWSRNIETPNDDPHLSGPKKLLAGCSKQDLYKLWWLSGGICNLSGVKGDWKQNSDFLLTFDRIVPGSKGGTYEWWNLQIVLVTVNMAKWDYSQDEAIEWITGYKKNGVVVIDD
ncbi:hypothetical protein BJ741DRAFT_583718 [Chytriomyces cf. hyalinus JEL632]|nr:hypothetical protein BJ741DRAFT_583718 [Chytriomyces cf. hyalinus JEL632]